MTPRVEEVCYRDAYARSLEARVLEVSTADGPPLVVLDVTAFYPGGGGQPSDRGVILRATDGRTWTVRAARRVGGEIVHELEPSGDGELPRRDPAKIRPTRVHDYRELSTGLVFQSPFERQDLLRR